MLPALAWTRPDSQHSPKHSSPARTAATPTTAPKNLTKSRPLLLQSQADTRFGSIYHDQLLGKFKLDQVSVAYHATVKPQLAAAIHAFAASPHVPWPHSTMLPNPRAAVAPRVAFALSPTAYQPIHAPARTLTNTRPRPPPSPPLPHCSPSLILLPISTLSLIPPSLLSSLRQGRAGGLAQELVSTLKEMESPDGAALTGVLFSSPWSWFELEQGAIRFDYLDWVAEAACSNTGLKVGSCGAWAGGVMSGPLPAAEYVLRVIRPSRHKLFSRLELPISM